jgi:hypothetical protein
MKRTVAENTTPVVADEILQPLLASALYVIETLGPHIVGLSQELRSDPANAPQTGTAGPREIEAALDRQVAAGIPFYKLPTHHRTQRLRTGGFSPDDPLLEVSFTPFARQLGLRMVPVAQWLPPVRRAFEEAVAIVGIGEAYGRDAALIAPAQGNELIPWTMPVGEPEATSLVFNLRAACMLVTAAVTGMRMSEIVELVEGCRLSPQEIGRDRVRYRITGKVVKGRPLGGKRRRVGGRRAGLPRDRGRGTAR